MATEFLSILPIVKNCVNSNRILEMILLYFQYFQANKIIEQKNLLSQVQYYPSCDFFFYFQSMLTYQNEKWEIRKPNFLKLNTRISLF